MKRKQKSCSSDCCSHCGDAPSNSRQQVHPDSIFAQQNHDLDLQSLSSELQNHHLEIVYLYVVATCKYDKDNHQFYLQCNAPNIEGKYISLTSCKHWMRSFKQPVQWVDNFWIAGVTSTNLLSDRRQRLFYLMNIGHSFSSFSELWNSHHIPNPTKEIKNASRNIFGDFYQLKPNVKNPTDHSGYIIPKSGHAHLACNRWYNDVSTEPRCGGRPSALLIGDPNQTYLWETPLIKYKSIQGQSQKKMTIAEFLSNLELS